MNNQERFLQAANYILAAEKNGQTHDINIRRKEIDSQFELILFNASKKLIYDGYSKEQEQLKGLIVKVDKSINQAIEVIAGCFPKFYNYGEGSENNVYKQYFNMDGGYIDFAHKQDGVNIRSYFNEATNQIEFATRGTLLGRVEGIDDEEDKFVDFGSLARSIAEEKYPILLDKKFNETYSCIFEMIHPECKIITNYGDKKDLILLAVFDKEVDFKELNREELITFAKYYKLNLIDYWLVDTWSNDFNNNLSELEQKWKDTDLEGTVAIFCDRSGPRYRLKIKNAHYLELLKLSQFCTIGYTQELCKANNFKSWDEFRDFLYQSDAMTEEIEIGYQIHFEKYLAWSEKIDKLKQQLLVEYSQVVCKLDKDFSRKDFALSILNNPNKSFFFSMLDWRSKNDSLMGFWETNGKALDLLEKLNPIQEIELVNA